jgi:hypothetical protein
VRVHPKFNFITCSILLVIIWILSIFLTNYYCNVEKLQLILIDSDYKIKLLENKAVYQSEVNQYIFQENNQLFQDNQELQKNLWEQGRQVN